MSFSSKNSSVIPQKESGGFPNPADAPLDMNNFKINNLADPVSAKDAANKQWVESLLSAKTRKDPVVAATTAAGTLASDFEDGDTLDGVVLSTGDDILIKDQASGVENGIYTVNASGAPTRRSDLDTGDGAAAALVVVKQGTENADTIWLCTNDSGSDIVGTNALVFANVTQTVTSYSEGVQEVANVVKLDINGLGAVSPSPAGSDFLVLYDFSTGLHKKVSVTTLFGSQSSSLILPRGYIDGLRLSRAPGTRNVTVFPGVCRDADDDVNIIVTAAFDKKIDTAWAAGDGNGGLPSNLTLTASTWYHFFVILDSYGSTVDAGFDTESDASNLLTDSGYSNYRRIGSVRTDGSSNILEFHQPSDNPNLFLWKAPILDVTISNPGTAAVNRTLSISPRASMAVINALVKSTVISPVNCYFRHPGVTDLSPSESVSPLSTFHLESTGTISEQLRIPASVSLIGTRFDASDANVDLKIATLGWIDLRGKQ